MVYSHKTVARVEMLRFTPRRSNNCSEMDATRSGFDHDLLFQGSSSKSFISPIRQFVS
jgi:hypothetical protein